MSRFAADAATLSAAVLLFLLLATYQIDLPGLYYDEALDAVPAMQIAQRVPTELHRDAGVTVGRYTYPLMVMDYVGPVNTYLLVPVFRLFGAGVLQIRLPMIALAATGLILSYVLVRRLFDRWTAAAAALLLAASPSFIFFSRQGIHVTSVMLPLLAGALLALDDWRRSGRHATLLLGAFLLGVGLAAKLLFLWFVIAGFLVSGFWFLVRNPNQKPETRNQKLRPFRDLAPVALAFVAGASPLVVFNLMTGGTVDVLGRNLATTGSGVDNAALLANLLTRFDNLRALLVGDHFWYFGDFPGNSLAFSVFLSGGLLGLLAAASPVPPAASSVMLNRSEASPRPEREAPGRCFAAAQHDNAPGRAGAPAVLPGSPSASPDASAVPSDVLSTMPCASSPARGSASAARGSPSVMLSRSEASPRTEPEAPGRCFAAAQHDNAGSSPSTHHSSLITHHSFAAAQHDDAKSSPITHHPLLITHHSFVIVGGFVALVVLESVWTVSGLLPTHYYALLPWVFVVAAEGWIGAARAVRARLRGRSGVGARLAALAAALGAGAVLTATFAGFLAVDLQYHRLLGTTGGYFTHSDAIYRLADYLDRNGVGQPVAMDWGIARNVQILTQGRVNPVEVFLYAAEPPPLFDDLLYKQIVVPGTVFIFHPDDSTIYRRRPRFQYWLDRLQKQAVLQQEILQRNGKVLFQVYAVP